MLTTKRPTAGQSRLANFQYCHNRPPQQKGLVTTINKKTTDLTPTQEAQLQWYFIKNNDEGDTDILTDNPTDDSISIDGLSMTVTVDPENIHRFGHAHCFVADSDDENGHALSELKRALDIVNVRGKNVIAPDATESNYRVQLNLEDVTPEEIASLQVKISETDTKDAMTEKTGKVESDLTIKHTLPAEHKVRQIDIVVHPEGKEQNYAKAITYARPVEPGEVTNVRGDDNEDEYIGELNNDVYHLKADAGLEDGTPVKTILHVKDSKGQILKSIERDSSVQNGKVSEAFEIEQLIKEEGLDHKQVHAFMGEITWEE